MTISLNRYWLQRFRRHLSLAALTLAFVAVIYALTPPPDARHRLSMATAYAATGLLAWTFCLGPWNLLRRRSNPVSFDVRRDVGIWAGALALLHTAIGLTVHLRGRMWMYFFRKLHPLHLQKGEFGWANWTGAVSVVLLILLLFISNDRSVRALRLGRWKALQQMTYLAALLALLHGTLFQLLEKRHLPWVLLAGTLAAIAITAQAVGAARHRSLAALRTPSAALRSFQT